MHFGIVQFASNKVLSFCHIEIFMISVFKILYDLHRDCLKLVSFELDLKVPVSQKYTQTRHIVIFAKTNETLSMKYICPSTTINTQHILFKFYCLTGLLGSVDLSSISIYNEAKYYEFYNISASNYLV